MLKMNKDSVIEQVNDIEPQVYECTMIAYESSDIVNPGCVFISSTMGRVLKVVGNMKIFRQKKIYSYVNKTKRKQSFLRI